MPQITNAKLADLFRNHDVMVKGRLDVIESKIDKLEAKVSAAGLNGEGATLKAFLEQLRLANVTHLQWVGVRADINRRLQFLSSPRNWLRAFFYAVLGGLGWMVVSRIPLPHL